MLIQIAVLAWLFLGESLGIRQVGGLLLATIGTLLVQLVQRQGRRAVVSESRNVVAQREID